MPSERLVLFESRLSCFSTMLLSQGPLSPSDKLPDVFIRIAFRPSIESVLLTR